MIELGSVTSLGQTRSSASQTQIQLDLAVSHAPDTLGLPLARPRHDWAWQCAIPSNVGFGTSQTQTRLSLIVCQALGTLVCVLARSRCDWVW
jgi:hypothetical protein